MGLFDFIKKKNIFFNKISSFRYIIKINRYSDCLEGRENKKTTLLKNIELIHFDIDIHKKFKQNGKTN